MECGPEPVTLTRSLLAELEVAKIGSENVRIHL